MPYAHVNGAHLYYHEHGAGEPVVLLHNFLATGETCWRKQIPTFRNHYRLIVPDLRMGAARTRITSSQRTAGLQTTSSPC